MRVLQPLLSMGEHLGHSLKGRVPWPLPGQAFITFLGSYITEGFIIYYIECCCLHFRYNQGNENNKCRRERWRADYALSLGKFTQALEITLKIGNKHLLFQTRAREFYQEQAITVCMHFLGMIPTGKPSLRVWLLSAFHTGLSHICQIKTKTVPYNFPPFFLFVRAVVVVNPTSLATCLSLYNPGQIICKCIKMHKALLESVNSWWHQWSTISVWVHQTNFLGFSQQRL